MATGCAEMDDIHFQRQPVAIEQTDLINCPRHLDPPPSSQQRQRMTENAAEKISALGPRLFLEMCGLTVYRRHLHDEGMIQERLGNDLVEDVFDHEMPIRLVVIEER